jgi:phosphoglycolate phosphatase
MKQNFDLVLFDLDGTLTDSGPGIMSSVSRALAEMGRPPLSPDTLRRFIGPPLFDSYVKLCHMTPEEAQEGIDRYRVHYRAGGIYDNRVFDGMFSVLEELRAAGKYLAVATSKPESMALDVLSHFGLRKYFDVVSAPDESERGNGKEELILPVLKKLSVFPSRAVMVGDTKFDAAGARNAGTQFLGVLFGFGTEEEMRREGGTMFARTPADITRLLLDKP